jgi:hypothetical protein
MWWGDRPVGKLLVPAEVTYCAGKRRLANISNGGFVGEFGASGFRDGKLAKLPF